MVRADLAGAAHLELVSGVVLLRPEDAVLEAMLSGWRGLMARRLKRQAVARRSPTAAAVSPCMAGRSSGNPLTAT